MMYYLSCLTYRWHCATNCVGQIQRLLGATLGCNRRKSFYATTLFSKDKSREQNYLDIDRRTCMKERMLWQGYVNIIPRNEFFWNYSLHLMDTKFNSRAICRFLSSVASDEAFSTTNDKNDSFAGLIKAYREFHMKGVRNDKLDLYSEDFSETSMATILQSLSKYYQKVEDIKQLNSMIAENDASDNEIVSMAQEDIKQIHLDIENLENEIYELVLPEEVAEQSDVILEVTAGVGGQEAMLFTKEIFEMYTGYAARKGWSVLIISADYTDLGGLRHATANISGVGAYMELKYEGGVHRVQRVPKTERSGRMHTSTMTVAVLPQPKEVDIYLNPKDLKIETCRASGKGGQHVNTTDSAVRVVHLPTGIAAECQTERSQIRNREAALRLLSSRLYDIELEKSVQKQIVTRKLQVGSASRNEKVRTYNMRDDRITDHRLKSNLFGVEEFLQGGEPLTQLIENLRVESRREELEEKLEKLTQLLVSACK